LARCLLPAIRSYYESESGFRGMEVVAERRKAAEFGEVKAGNLMAAGLGGEIKILAFFFSGRYSRLSVCGTSITC